MTISGSLVRVLLLGVAVLSAAAARAAPPQAVAGVLDLSHWQGEIDAPVRLDGEWGFHEGRLLDPADPAAARSPPALARVPGTWSGSRTWATYTLEIVLPPEPQRLALRVLTMGTAYRLYADGRLVAANGSVANEPAAAAPAYEPRVAELRAPQSDSLRLVLQVSNFHYAKGGAWEPMWLGAPEAVRDLRERSVGLTFWLTGGFVVIALYHLALWSVRRREPSPFYFAVGCTAMVVRTLTVDEMLLVDLAPWVPWSWLVRLEYVSMLIMMLAFAPFLRLLLPDEVPRRLVQVVVAGGVTLTLVTLVTPPEVFSGWLPLYQIYLVTCILIAPVLIARAVVRRRPGASLLLMGLLAITLTGIHDTLLSWLRDLPALGPVDSSIYLLPFGLFAFVLSQSIVLGIRFSHAFVALEQTTDLLREAHAELDSRAQELEARVTDRTADLERANRRLARQASIDGLTQIGNRRFYETEMRREWAAHTRRAAPLSLLLCDVDRFKNFNDRYGHLQGDEALRAVAAAVTEAASRPGDLVARYGGEELVVLLPDTDAAGALEVAERLRHRVEALEIPHQASDAGSVVTISVGVATAVPSADQEPEALLERADRALYGAKEGGRNRVAAASEGVP